MVDKKPGESVSLECPYCNGEMFEAKNDPSEKTHLGRALRRASIFVLKRH